MLRIGRGQQAATEFQRSFARAGHAHAGVFVVFALVAQILADAGELDGIADFLARNGIWAAAVLFPAGFFLSSARRGVTAPNRLILLVYAESLPRARGLASVVVRGLGDRPARTGVLRGPRISPVEALWVGRCEPAAVERDALRNLLTGSGREHLLVQGGEARGDLHPVVSAAVCLRASAARPAFLAVVSGRDEGVDERVFVVGRNEPAGFSVGDDRRRAVRAAGDHRETAGHRLDEDEPERLGDRGQDEHVGRVQRPRELLVRAPAGQEDLSVSDPPRRDEGMLPLPLAGMASRRARAAPACRVAEARARGR
jgi:hypothetical protein